MISKFHKQWTRETIRWLYVLLPCSAGPFRNPQSSSPLKQKSAASHQLTPVRQLVIRSLYRASFKHNYVNIYIYIYIYIYIINQQDATLAVLCLLKTTGTLYMFRTPFASIFRSTINCNSSHWCLS